jgi:A/G-specific adenine glycosylase
MKQTKSTLPFARILLKWDLQQNDRQMPWKGEKDPYRIWLSEIILQQTRVEQGLAYYQRFIKRFPTVRDLAKATDQEVFKFWEGLGYYTRCRNLLVTARFIAGELNGRFPSQYETIRQLKGVGPYTAAAISSFAFGLPLAVVDGNVFRVLSRITGNATPVDSKEGKKLFSELAQEWISKEKPAEYNQAIMDFGATVCKPQVPLCGQCVFKNYCVAFRDNKVNELPVKEKKTGKRKRWFNYVVIRHGKDYAVSQRKGNDIWQGLYEFPMIESGKPQKATIVLETFEKNNWLKKDTYELLFTSEISKQQLSHQLIEGRFIVIRAKRRPEVKEWQWMSLRQLKTVAFPKIINAFRMSSIK